MIDLKLITQKEKDIFWRINYLDLDTVLEQNINQNPNNKIIIMDRVGLGKSTCYEYGFAKMLWEES